MTFVLPKWIDSTGYNGYIYRTLFCDVFLCFTFSDICLVFRLLRRVRRGREGGGLPCPFSKIGKKCPNFGKKCPDCGHLCTKFFI